MRKMMALLLAGAMALSLTGCSGSGTNTTTAAAAEAQTTTAAATEATKEQTTAAPEADTKLEGLNIYGIYKSESAYFVNEAASIEKTLQELGEQYGFEATWHFNNCDGDPEKFMTLVDTAIADKCDAILACVPDQTMSQSVVDKCAAAGVPIIAVDDGLIDDAGEKIAPWFGIDAYNIGYAAGEWMAEYAATNNLLEDETVGLLYMTMDTVSSCVPRTEGERDAWKEKAGDALADRTYSADYVSTQEDAFNNASAVITGHPEIKTWLVMVASENGALGAGAAVENAGLAESSCVITLGCDEMVGQWADGNYEIVRAASYFSGKVVGKEAITSVVEYLVNGTEIPKEYATPAVICTPENYQDVVL
ncbi:MAG: substrate-binding domain-containing protein [Lachnospiraceae bacterium]|nr:substrate-binding domain-containing protein [Lachnospiraceae bacterium]